QADTLYNKLKEYLWVDDDLRIRTKIHSHHFHTLFQDLFKGIRFDYIAAAAQKLVETLLVDLVKKAVKKTGLSTVVLAGGVFMNVKANQEILKLEEVKKLFIMPSCGDESLPIGSCYYGTWLQHKELLKTLQPLTNLYLGPEYSQEDIERALQHHSFDYKNYDKKINIEVSRLLAEGHIVARFDGRMEFGARALGNRSILADASNGDVIDIINRMVKMRDFWMPFAPSVLEEYAQLYIKNPELLQKTQPYFMMHAFETTPLAQKDLKAAMHPYDKTIRPQIVHKAHNPKYHELLTYYMKRTGRYGFLNTSFNIHGDPIVCSPEDALHTLKNSGLHYLSLGNFLVWK
ncbi:MAG: carbamoyltransferase C-terminal domain-containing protein, partial [Nanoarchaeota archaeon]